jgi:NADH-quinone oxidoreductase subunit K
MAIPLSHFLTVAAILFTLGIFGIFLNRKNVIIILMSIELMLLAINLNLVAFSAYLGDLAGQVFAMFVLTVAAAEAAIGLVLLVELVLVFGSWALAPETLAITAQQPTPLTRTNTEALGDLLYTDYFYLFQAAGLILLVAMIGAITLTLRHKVDVRRQSIAEQVHRSSARAVELRKVQPGSGV